MKKSMLSLSLILGFGFTVLAQTESAVKKISGGLEFGLPASDGFEHFLLAGGMVQLEWPVVKTLNVTGSAGFVSLMLTGDERAIAKGYHTSLGMGMFPLKTGMKYYFAKNFYGAGEVGVAIPTTNGGDKRVFLLLAPTLGTALVVADKYALDFGLRYENWNKYGRSDAFVALRAAFAFGL